MSIKIKAIVAMDEMRAIGKNNALPWNIPEDMKHFVKCTKGHTVLMGRKTFQSTPMNSRPLPKRKNIIVTRSPEAYSHESDDVELVSDPLVFLQNAKSGDYPLRSEMLWVIGGAEIYRLTMPLWDEVELTKIPGTHDGDAFFPEFEEQFELASEEDIGPCAFLRYTRKL